MNVTNHLYTTKCKMYKVTINVDIKTTEMCKTKLKTLNDSFSKIFIVLKMCK